MLRFKQYLQEKDELEPGDHVLCTAYLPHVHGVILGKHSDTHYKVKLQDGYVGVQHKSSFKHIFSSHKKAHA